MESEQQDSGPSTGHWVLRSAGWGRRFLSRRLCSLEVLDGEVLLEPQTV